jgi:hypothetical protein
MHNNTRMTTTPDAEHTDFRDILGPLGRAVLHCATSGVYSHLTFHPERHELF